MLLYIGIQSSSLGGIRRSGVGYVVTRSICSTTKATPTVEDGLSHDYNGPDSLASLLPVREILPSPSQAIC